MRRSTLSLLILLILAAPFTLVADQRGFVDAPHPDAPDELQQFAFLIGSWQCDVEYLGADWKTPQKGKGTWTAQWALDGWAVIDNFRGVFSPGYLATTIRVYNPRHQTWHGYWVDPKNGYWSKPLIGKKTPTGMLLETEIQTRDPEGNVVDVDLRYEFLDIKADSFHWRQNSSLDGGETWRENTMTIDCKRDR
ncbi:MAG: hypothetical protein AAGD38_00200 [Acidobacteriota bacterium]